MTKVVIDPVTRVEGHVRLELEINGGVVTSAKCSGTSFRGIELICQGRDPLDMGQLTQRTCGVCSSSHGLAAVAAIEQSSGLKIPTNAQLIRQIVLAASFITSHIINFYQLSLPDYLGNQLPENINKVLVEHQALALDMFRKTNEGIALLVGKVPHVGGIVVGGVTEPITAVKVFALLSRVRELRNWLNNVYREDLHTLTSYYPQDWVMGSGCKRYLAYGGMDDVFTAGVCELGGTKEEFSAAAISEATEANSYSLVKAPRYNGKPYETGPLARLLLAGQSEMLKLGTKAGSVWGRHWARAEEALMLTDTIERWLEQLQPLGPVSSTYKPLADGKGVALLESPAGALGHWVTVKKGKVVDYQIISGSTWNLSPTDQKGQLGPLEQALMGTPVADSTRPSEVLRVVRSFDPCMSCAVH